MEIHKCYKISTLRDKNGVGIKDYCLPPFPMDVYVLDIEEVHNSSFVSHRVLMVKLEDTHTTYPYKYSFSMKDSEFKEIHPPKMNPSFKLTNFLINTRMQLGGDPEVFVKGKDGNIIPAWKFLPSKKLPLKVGAQDIFWDGFQSEFTISPQTCIAYLVDGIHNGFKFILSQARQLDPQATLTSSCVERVSEEDLLNGKEEHIQLGCSPSLHVYPNSETPSMDGRSLPLRVAGAHIHFGHILPPSQVEGAVKLLDAILGVTFVSLLEGLESPLRRQFYGMAGEYRLPPHGLEYRVLPSTILLHPGLVHLAYDLGRITFNMAKSGLSSLWDASPSEVRMAIDIGDVSLARKILSRNEIVLRELLKKCYPSLYTPEWKKFIPLLLQGGFKEKISLDMDANWHVSPSSPSWQLHSEGKNCNFTKWITSL